MSIAFLLSQIGVSIALLITIPMRFNPAFPDGPYHTLIVSLSCIAIFLAAGIWTSLLIRRTPRNRKNESMLPGLLAGFSSFGLCFFAVSSDLFIPIVFVMAVIMISATNRPVSTVLLGGLTGLAHALLLYFRDQTVLSEVVLLISVLVILAAVLSRKILKEWRKQEKLFEQTKWAASEFAQANVRLQDALGNAENWMRENERTRIAREIHDTVGYALTAVLVQIRAVQEELKIDPSVLPPRLDQLEGLLRETIQEVRKEVSRLRESEDEMLDWRTKWMQLCKVFAAFTGIRMNVDIGDELHGIRSEMGSSIYRIIQEALTNAYRHGRAGYIDVAAGWKEEEGALLLRISDDGMGAESLTLGSGLKGIRERVDGMGGTVAWETQPEKGFDLGIAIPWKRETDEKTAAAVS